MLPASRSRWNAESGDLARKIRGIAAGVSLAWAAAVFLAPLVASRPRGSLGYLVSLALYSIGSVVCHQRPERSFALWDAQLPVCARCTGLYLGAAAMTLVVLWCSAARIAAATRVIRLRVGPAPAALDAVRKLEPVRLGLMIAFLPMVLTLVYEWSGGGAPGNWIRAFSAVPPGLVIAWIVLKVN